VTYVAKDVWVRAVLDVMVVNLPRVFVGDWKGFPIDTPIPTPEGFKPIVRLSIGDTIFGGNGAPCRVVGKSQREYRQCYRISFDDKTSIVCDDQHQWLLTDGSVVGTPKLRVRDKIALASPVQYPAQDLPIDPYVFGLWVADGKHTSSEISKPDTFVWDEIQRRGYSIGNDTSGAGNNCPTRTVKGIRKHLHALGVHGNRHIPEIYMRAPVQQRIDLLRGLMDGDGNVNAVRKQAVFTTASEPLSTAVKSLLESLGQRVNQAHVIAHGFGLTIDAYPLAFRPQALNPFLLPRKADRVLAEWGNGKSWYRRIVSVERTIAQETVCIAVDSADHTFLCGENYIKTHNTGKRKPESQQLELSAAIAAALHPEADEFDTMFLWLKDKAVDKEHFKRSDIGAIWSRFLPRVERLETAVKNDDFPPKPSGLCAKWCPVKTCEYCGE
jgi:hypothetical protein